LKPSAEASTTTPPQPSGANSDVVPALFMTGRRRLLSTGSTAISALMKVGFRAKASSQSDLK
jgi:hypothetical protein